VRERDGERPRLVERLILLGEQLGQTERDYEFRLPARQSAMSKLFIGKGGEKLGRHKSDKSEP
jgi:hypothetical protein